MPSKVPNLMGFHSGPKWSTILRGQKAFQYHCMKKSIMIASQGSQTKNFTSGGNASFSFK